MNMEEARKRRQIRLIQKRNNEMIEKLRREQKENERRHELEMKKLKEELDRDDLKHKQQIIINIIIKIIIIRNFFIT